MANVTMRDLGRMLGVSAVTISKALSGKSGVSEDMRLKILRLAEETGYVNPKAAPAPKGQDVGILVPEHFFSNDTFYAMFYKQLVEALAESGRFGLLELITRDMQESLTPPNLIRGKRVDGLILLGQPDEAYARMLAELPIPAVALDFYCPELPMDAVVSDGLCGAAAMTRALIGAGHRDIGFLGSVRTTSSIMERYLGFHGEMLRQGLAVRPECVLPDRDDAGLMHAPALPETLPTAFVCNCDIAARALIGQVQSLGLRVPEDVSVVGFDDFNNVPGSLPLTTWWVDTAAMCRIAVNRIAQRLAGAGEAPCRVVVPGQIVIRDSVSHVTPQ